MSKIDEERVKFLVYQYQSGNSSVLNALIREVSLYVYNFPLVVYNRPRDEASEFYIYFMERFESVVRNFRDRGFKFSTYLTASLINAYKNFLAVRRKTIRVIYESELNSMNLLCFFQEEIGKEADEMVLKAVEFFDQLDEFSKLIIKTFIFELTPEDLKLVSRYTDKPIEQVTREYEEILQRVGKKYEKRKKLIDSINANPKKRKLERLRSLNILCGYADVGKLLNMSVSNVGVSLKRIRDKFRSYISSGKFSTTT
ncbi:MAG: hypothetical protein ABDH28_00425 [Brevinematia bacterium]